MSHQSLSRQTKTKSESPTVVEFGCRTPKSDHLQPWSLGVEHPSQMTAAVRMFILTGLVGWFFAENPQVVAYSAQSLTPPPSLTGEQYGKMEPKYPEGDHCQSVLRHQCVLNVPLCF